MASVKDHSRKRSFKVGDRVYLSKHFSNYMPSRPDSGFIQECRRGTVQEVFCKEESGRGAKRTWLTILWDGYKTPSNHASQRIRFESELS